MKKRLISAIIALAMTLTAMPCVTLAKDADPEPVLRYTFDGSNALADQNGNSAPLTLKGGASITEDGNVKKGLLLDGVDGYALLPKNILSDSMTITAWVKLNKLTTWGRVFDFGTDSNNNFFFAPYSGGAARVEMKSPKSTDTMDCAQEMVKGDWVHYAVTVAGGTVSYYRNGRLINSKSGVQSLSNIKDELNYIGKSHYDGDAYLSAVIDDFRVYDTALDRDEICDVVERGIINSEIMLDSYTIEDGQIITGDKIVLPDFQGGQKGGLLPSDSIISWTSNNNDIIRIDKTTESGIAEIHHPEKTTPVKLTAEWVRGCAGLGRREYTVYVTGTDENPYTVSIDASDRTKKISDTMWGLFFEDINSSADGGLYAEMVQNRSFEMDDHLYSWETSGDVKVNTENPLNENNPTYVTLGKGASITNDGFQGMNVKAGEKYTISIYCRAKHFSVRLDLIGDNGQVIATKKGAGVYSGEEDFKKVNSWCKDPFDTILTPTEDAKNATLKITVNSETPVDIDMVSLIPEDTYKGHGLRKDLMEKLEEMHPSFLRFPGGCAVEGHTMDEAWNWKDTIGDVSERKEMINIWDGDGTYKMTYGLGFYEYFQMSEDLGMEPVPILNCGMACQVRSGSAEDEAHLVPMDKLQPYIDDALDLIAFANGTDESNPWTKKRIEMGHKEPFNMKYIGIGNEQYGEIYWERYAEFAKQIHAKYPDINLVTTSGTASSGTGNDLAWNWANDNQELADLMDEHYYESADWFRSHAYRYDNYRRDTNTKVFLGEYASKGNTWYNALSEAAFMTGLERNADVVKMASYAPMFAKYGNVQWGAANMIWFNNDDYVLTPNYHVQSLFSNNRGDYSLPTMVKMNGIEKDDKFHGGIAVGSWGTHNEFKDIKLSNTDGSNVSSLKNDDWKFTRGEWTVNSEDALVQSSDETGSTAFYDIPFADNYAVSLKAKKTAGGEGFQIGVAAEDGQNYYRINIGGWGNTTAKVQRIVNGVSSESGNVAEQSYVGNVHINDNEWYDVRVEMSDYEIKAYLNDEFICSYVKPQEYGPVYASSVYDEETGEVVVKLVNTMDSDVNVGVNINGADIESNIAKTVVMSGDTSLENSLENKDAIAPAEGRITNASNEFTYNAKANSLSIIRLQTADAPQKTAYISGYTDGTFRPDKEITRPEMAVMFAKLGGIDESRTYKHNFEDIPSNAWYSNYAGFAAQKGYIHGCGDYGSVSGHFMPAGDTTRAEFASVMCHYMGIADDYNSLHNQDSKYSDVTKEHWALAYINAVSDNGLMKGYPDGTFKPDEYITRAEAVTAINLALGRDADSIQTAQNPFKDVSPSHWAYNQILEAVMGY